MQIILADIQDIIYSFSFFELVYVNRKAQCCAKETYMGRGRCEWQNHPPLFLQRVL
jgi:hypothetical protein